MDHENHQKQLNNMRKRTRFFYFLKRHSKFGGILVQKKSDGTNLISVNTNPRIFDFNR